MKIDFSQIIDNLEKEYIKVWQDICNIESPTSSKEDVDKVGKYVYDWASKLGFDVEILPVENAGDVICITMNKDSAEKPICFSGHMDTVHAKGIFDYPPTRVEDDIIYGPGVTDCKGGIVCAMFAMHTLKECGFDKSPVMLLVQSDEEMGSRPSKRKTINYICEKAKDAVAFINLEGNGEYSKACISRKGIAGYIFKITGQEAHSSESAILGANAILEASHKIIELEKIKEDKGITINCGTIIGGTVPNTVPGYCEFKANIRFATNEQLEWVDEYVRKIADTVYVDGCKCEVEKTGFRIMMEDCQRNRDLLDKINECLKAESLPILSPQSRKGGSDAADVTSCNIPCIDSIGVVGGYIHSNKEWAYIDSLKLAAKRLVAIAKNI